MYTIEREMVAEENGDGSGGGRHGPRKTTPHLRCLTLNIRAQLSAWWSRYMNPLHIKSTGYTDTVRCKSEIEKH